MAINVGNASAAKIVSSSSGGDRLIQVRNTGANPVSLGKSSAITAGGTGTLTLANGTSTQVDIETGEELYGICASGLTTTIETL